MLIHVIKSIEFSNLRATRSHASTSSFLDLTLSASPSLVTSRHWDCFLYTRHIAPDQFGVHLMTQEGKGPFSAASAGKYPEGLTCPDLGHVLRTHEHCGQEVDTLPERYGVRCREEKKLTAFPISESSNHGEWTHLMNTSSTCMGRHGSRHCFVD